MTTEISPLDYARQILRGDESISTDPPIPTSNVEILDEETAADISELQREAVELEASIYRDSLADFVAWAWPQITGFDFAPNRATDRVIQALQDVADGKVWRLLIAVSPGTGKSTMLACYSAWRLARNPAHRSIHAGHSFDLARTESLRVRRLIEGDPYRALFPGVKLREDESTAGAWATTEDGRYFAVGTDAGLTGRRAHEAICDDPLNAIDRFSKAARETLWAWFTESLSTRLDGDRAPMIVVQQRLDRDDLIGRLLATDGGWTIVEVPAEDESGLWAPNVLPRAKLDALKRDIGAATYATQYLQRPSDDSAAIVQRKWWRFHRPMQLPDNTPRPAGCDTTVPAVVTPEQFDRIVISVDMTFGGTKTSNDFCDVAVWASVGGARYLLERWHRRATQLEQRAAIRELAGRYPRAKVLIEKAAGGAGALEILQADGIANIVPVSPGGKNKAERLGLVSPAIEGGNCYLPLGVPWLADFVEELAGASRHDDAMDTTSYALADLATNVPRQWMRWR